MKPGREIVVSETRLEALWRERDFGPRCLDPDTYNWAAVTVFPFRVVEKAAVRTDHSVAAIDVQLGLRHEHHTFIGQIGMPGHESAKRGVVDNRTPASWSSAKRSRLRSSRQVSWFRCGPSETLRVPAPSLRFIRVRRVARRNPVAFGEQPLFKNIC